MANPDPSPGHRWKPGQSGNPGGRPKGLERKVRELVDFDRIVAFLADVALGTGVGAGAKMRDRIEAAKLLCDRGFGKARQTVDIAADVNSSGLAGIDVTRMDAITLKLLIDAVDGSILPSGAPDVIDVGPADVIDASSSEVERALPASDRK
jgi:hypothetical protein